MNKFIKNLLCLFVLVVITPLAFIVWVMMFLISIIAAISDLSGETLEEDEEWKSVKWFSKLITVFLNWFVDKDI